MFDTSSFNNVFDTMEEDESSFDTIFGGEEDDDLMDAVIGFNESGESLPDEDELHLKDEDSEPSDLDEYLGPDNDTSNSPTTQPSGIETMDDEMDLISGNDTSDAGAFYNDEDENYQKGVDESGCNKDDDSIKETDEDLYDEDDDDDFFDEVSNDIDDSDLEMDEDIGDESVDESYFFESSDDEDEEDDLISAVEDDDTSSTLNKDLAYDTDDEELVDMVSGE